MADYNKHFKHLKHAGRKSLHKRRCLGWEGLAADANHFTVVRAGLRGIRVAVIGSVSESVLNCTNTHKTQTHTTYTINSSPEDTTTLWLTVLSDPRWLVSLIVSYHYSTYASAAPLSVGTSHISARTGS